MRVCGLLLKSERIKISTRAGVITIRKREQKWRDGVAKRKAPEYIGCPFESAKLNQWKVWRERTRAPVRSRSSGPPIESTENYIRHCIYQTFIAVGLSSYMIYMWMIDDTIAWNEMTNRTSHTSQWKYTIYVPSSAQLSLGETMYCIIGCGHFVCAAHGGLCILIVWLLTRKKLYVA